MNADLVQVGTILSEIDENNKIVRELVCYKLTLLPNINNRVCGWFMIFNKKIKLQKTRYDYSYKNTFTLNKYEIEKMDDKKFLISDTPHFCKINELENVFYSFDINNLKLLGLTIDCGCNYFDNEEEDIKTFYIYFRNNKRFLEIIVPSLCSLFDNDCNIPFVYIKDFDIYNEINNNKHSKYLKFNQKIVFENLEDLSKTQISDIFNLLPFNGDLKNQKGLNFKYFDENILQIYDFDDTESIMSVGNGVHFNKSLFKPIDEILFKSMFI